MALRTPSAALAWVSLLMVAIGWVIMLSGASALQNVSAPGGAWRSGPSGPPAVVTALIRPSALWCRLPACPPAGLQQQRRQPVWGGRHGRLPGECVHERRRAAALQEQTSRGAAPPRQPSLRPARSPVLRPPNQPRTSTPQAPINCGRFYSYAWWALAGAACSGCRA